jgi:uncharacterized membrane protein
MFGFILGTACLVAFILVYKRGMRSHHFGRSTRRWLFHRLDTSPAQERVVRNAMLNVKQRFNEVTKDQAETRRQLADMLRRGSLDNEEVRRWFADREHELSQVREAAVDAFGEVYDALDDQQREQLAKWIEKGCWSHRRPGHGPYRAPTEAA